MYTVCARADLHGRHHGIAVPLSGDAYRRAVLLLPSAKASLLCVHLSAAFACIRLRVPTITTECECRTVLLCSSHRCMRIGLHSVPAAHCSIIVPRGITLATTYSVCPNAISRGLSSIAS